jgi:DNA-binding NarL/FixJ family response regulator
MTKEKKIVLVVDDSTLILERIIPLLEEINNIQRVVTANNFREAVKLISEIGPDMVLLDIHLPDKSGIELLRTIRQKHKGTIVLMITNHASEYYRDICKALGAKYFFDKSADFDLITEAISLEATT